MLPSIGEQLMTDQRHRRERLGLQHHIRASHGEARMRLVEGVDFGSHQFMHGRWLPIRSGQQIKSPRQ